MTIATLTADEIAEYRSWFLSETTSKRLAQQREEEFLPVESVLELDGSYLRIIDHLATTIVPDTSEGPVHFTQVMNGALSLRAYERIERRYLKALERLFRSSGRCIIQSALGYFTDDQVERALRFFGPSDRDYVMLFISFVQSHANDSVVEIRSWQLVRLLFQLALREFAMSPFVLPGLGLALLPQFDLRVLTVVRNRAVYDRLASVMQKSGLSMRELTREAKAEEIS